MEAAPLTRAHAHASKATHQQTLHNFKLASQEHKDAAEEFGKAEKETEDPESHTPYSTSLTYSNFVSFGENVHKLALRTLALLQQHHRDLSSRLLASTVQTPPTPPPNQTSFSAKDSTMAKPVTPTATTFSPPTSPKHRPPPLFGPESGKPESPNLDKPKMFFQPSTPTTPSTSDNPSHPSGTRKIAPPPIPLPSPTTITTQTLTYTSMRDGPVLPSPNPFQLAHELANARGIRSPVRGRSPATTGNDRNFLQVREPEPGARAASAGGTVRGTSPVLLNAPPRKERRKSASATSPVVGPREGLPFDSFKGPAPREGPIRPAVQEYDSSAARGVSPNPPKLDTAFTKFYSQFEEYIDAVGNPLAYAGLPLDGDLSSMDPALRKAVADKGAAESFYVVPTTGGTMSYAGILTRNQQPPNGEKNEAAATPAAGQAPAGKPVSTKTREELEFENTQLRQMTDMMAHKLHTWETSAKVNAAKMRESLQVLKETSHNSSSPVTEESDRPFGKSRLGGRSRDFPLKLGGAMGKTETQTLTLPDRQADGDLPPTPRLAPRTLTLPGRGAVDDYEPPKTPRFGGGFPKDFDDDKPAKSNRATSPNPLGKARGISPMPGSSKPRALSPAPSVLSENPTMEELQAEVARLRQHENKILKENDKLKTVVGKYRDRWEKLKEGARARRAEQEAGEEGETKSEAPDAKSTMSTATN